MKKLPYRATTQTGDRFDFDFPLHAETASPMRVNQMLTTLLESLDRDIAIGGETANGDVLQALAMALATRARMVHTTPHQSAQLARSLVENALDAASMTEREAPQSGNA